MTKPRHLTLERALLLLLALYISSCNSFASVNVAYAPRPSSRLYRYAQPGIRDVEPPNNKNDKRLEYQLRKQEWLDRYGSVEALQKTFGSTKGDLSPEQTRRLYHTLLPRSLLGLYEMGLMKPQELAPLAYEARIAAKQYARRRCVWYARIATQLFDQYRNLRDQGRLKFGHTSPTWDEIWSKYEAQIVQEECAAALEQDHECKPLKEKDLTMRIYLRILEKSTATNKAFDKLFLKKNEGIASRSSSGGGGSSSSRKTTTNHDTTDEEMTQLQLMGQQLEEDVRKILLGPKDSVKALKKATKLETKRAKALEKQQAREQKRLEKLEKKKQKELEKQQEADLDRIEKEQKRLEKEQKTELKEQEKRLKEVLKRRQEEEDEWTEEETDSEEEEGEEEAVEVETPEVAATRKKSATENRWQILKILAGTRKMFRVLRDDGKLKGRD